MKKQILLVALTLVLSSNALYAENLFTTLRGKIVTNHPKDILVVVTETDGSILDIAGINKDGTYILDLTIMDTPSLSEVNKLIIEVKNKSGIKDKYPVKKYSEFYGETVLIKPFIFN